MFVQRFATSVSIALSPLPYVVLFRIAVTPGFLFFLDLDPIQDVSNFAVAEILGAWYVR